MTIVKNISSVEAKEAGSGAAHAFRTGISRLPPELAFLFTTKQCTKCGKCKPLTHSGLSKPVKAARVREFNRLFTKVFG